MHGTLMRPGHRWTTGIQSDAIIGILSSDLRTRYATRSGSHPVHLNQLQDIAIIGLSGVRHGYTSLRSAWTSRALNMMLLRRIAGYNTVSAKRAVISQ